MSSFKIGMTALEVVVEIAKSNPKIDAMFFHTYIPRKTLKEIGLQYNHSIKRLLSSNPDDFRFRMCPEKIIHGNLEEIINELEKNRVLAVDSPVMLNDRITIKEHILMVDFNCKANSANLCKIIEFFQTIKQTGVILESGQSFHFYSMSPPVDEDKWVKFLGRCLLFTGFVDTRYVGHRLNEGYASLRISAGGTRSTIPKVVAVV